MCRLRLNAILVMVIAGMSLGSSPEPAQATAAVAMGGGCGVCWYSDEGCPAGWQRESHCLTLCGVSDAGECIDGKLFYQMYECSQGVPDFGWECGAS